MTTCFFYNNGELHVLHDDSRDSVYVVLRSLKVQEKESFEPLRTGGDLPKTDVLGRLLQLHSQSPVEGVQGVPVGFNESGCFRVFRHDSVK